MCSGPFEVLTWSVAWIICLIIYQFHSSFQLFFIFKFFESTGCEPVWRTLFSLGCVVDIDHWHFHLALLTSCHNIFLWLLSWYSPDCIGSAFNIKGAMQCPNCRKIEKGQWLYANGCRTFPEFNMDEWAHDEDLYDLSYSEMVMVYKLLLLLSYLSLGLMVVRCQQVLGKNICWDWFLLYWFHNLCTFWP